MKSSKERADFPLMVRGKITGLCNIFFRKLRNTIVIVVDDMSYVVHADGEIYKSAHRKFGK
jgi:hypothetical protein